MCYLKVLPKNVNLSVHAEISYHLKQKNETPAFKLMIAANWFKFGTAWQISINDSGYRNHKRNLTEKMLNLHKANFA